MKAQSLKVIADNRLSISEKLVMLYFVNAAVKKRLRITHKEISDNCSISATTTYLSIHKLMHFGLIKTVGTYGYGAKKIIYEVTI